MEQRLVPGIAVNYAGKSWRVRRPLGPEAILLCNDQGEVVSADPARISFPDEDKIFSNRIRDERCFSDAQWAEAERRREIVMRLGGNPTRTRARMDEAAKELGICRRRLWEILRDGTQWISNRRIFAKGWRAEKETTRRRHRGNHRSVDR